MEVVLSNQIGIEEKRQRNHSIILSTLPVELWNIVIHFSSFYDLKRWRLACSTLNQLIFERLLKHNRQQLFRYSALFGDMDLIFRIYNRFKNESKEMIEASVGHSAYYAFRSSAGNGHLHILQYSTTARYMVRWGGSPRRD